MDASTQALLRRLAEKYVWWKTFQQAMSMDSGLPLDGRLASARALFGGAFQPSEILKAVQ